MVYERPMRCLLVNKYDINSNDIVDAKSITNHVNSSWGINLCRHLEEEDSGCKTGIRRKGRQRVSQLSVPIARCFRKPFEDWNELLLKDPRSVRVRLSVPTAIQLYDLQDRLELNQPSKVVDWLLNVANHEINELPFLQMPSENFSLEILKRAKEHHQSNVNFSGINPTKVPLKLLNSSTMGNEYSDPAALGEFSATYQNCN
ncbi:hypothetical protein L1887_22904 [Cichorium endivia]|nr:hypothetical protein L1887_22904 [Cichorium endivia]